MSKSVANLWLDGAILGVGLATTATGLAFWQAAALSTTAEFLGLSRQVWLAAHLGSGALSLVGVGQHVAWHWDWLKALRGRSLGTLPTGVRVNRVVDRVMWLCFMAASASGALAAALRLGSVSGGVVDVPGRLHFALSVAWTVTAGVHLGLHREWIKAMTRRCLVGSGSSGVRRARSSLDSVALSETKALGRSKQPAHPGGVRTDLPGPPG